MSVELTNRGSGADSSYNDVGKETGQIGTRAARHNGWCSYSSTTTAYIIIAVEFCERLAYYGLGGSLVLFFQRVMNMQNAQADVNYSAWSAMCYITPLIGGYIADVYQARYKTILFFATIYLFGLVLAVFSAVPGNSYPSLVFISLYIIALGTGGIKPNVSTLGADQFDDRIESERREKESFFSWFYFSINVGAFVAYIAVSYVCQFGLGDEHGGEEWGFFYGYLIPCCSMAVGVMLFIAGNRLFGYSDGRSRKIGGAEKMTINKNKANSSEEVVPGGDRGEVDSSSVEFSPRLTAIEDGASSDRHHGLRSQLGSIDSAGSDNSDSTDSSTTSTGYSFSEAISPKVLLSILAQGPWLYLLHKSPIRFESTLLATQRRAQRNMREMEDFPHSLKHSTKANSHRFAKTAAGGAGTASLGYNNGEEVLSTTGNPLGAAAASSALSGMAGGHGDIRKPTEHSLDADFAFDDHTVGMEAAISTATDGRGGEEFDSSHGGIDTASTVFRVGPSTSAGERAPAPSPVDVLDYAGIEFEKGGHYSSKQVAASKLVARLFPFLGVFVMFWTVYSQMSVGFQNQGCQMNLNLSGTSNDSHDGELPIAALQVFDTIAIMIVVPLLDQIVYPWCRKRFRWNPPLIWRIQMGFWLCVIAMFLAGIIEFSRKQYVPHYGPGQGGYTNKDAYNNRSPCINAIEYDPAAYQTYWQYGRYQQGLARSYGVTQGYDPSQGPPAHCDQTCDHTWLYPGNIEMSRPHDVLKLNDSCISCDNLPQKSTMSVLWQIPQFFLIGSAEVLSSVSSMEFFYSQTPASFRSVVSSFSLSTTALGSLFVIPLVYLVNANPQQQWVTADLNFGHLDWFFYLLACLMVINIFILRYIGSGFVYLSDKDIEDRIKSA